MRYPQLSEMPSELNRINCMIIQVQLSHNDHELPDQSQHGLCFSGDAGN